MRPQQVLERFSISQKSRGGRMLLHLTYQIAVGRQVSEIVQEMMREEKLARPAVYSMMKREAAPLLEADCIALEAVGLPPLRKGTVTELARNLARLC